jgi:predicted nucleotidyltransferase
MPQLEQLIAETKTALSGLYGDRLAQVVLYGSHARGDAEAESDIDLMAVLKGPVNPITEIKRSNPVLCQLSLAFGTDISCIFMAESRFVNETSPLMLNVRREGKPV